MIVINIIIIDLCSISITSAEDYYITSITIYYTGAGATPALYDSKTYFGTKTYFGFQNLYIYIYIYILTNLFREPGAGATPAAT